MIRVTSYNILADSLIDLTTPKDDLKTNENNFSWEKRRVTILNELKTLNSDIICVQEFEKDEKFIEEMGKNGYNLCFKTRTGENHKEGNAIFWKFDK